MGIHINMTEGDFIFAAWNEGDNKRYKHTIHELRKQGYRKVNVYHGYLNCYEVYKKKNSRNRVTVTTLCM
ncbi:hypothetical protein ORL59_19085 [Bacillus cereus]|uniref:hypothetical protein n=1 Tax=Bacillus cereus TaxID=1396 RepID=UPI002ABF7CE8|nr:hypothetical protein [Bacillus cereus]MDZ4415687.1 hypothetical protein [Bacillus cereus]